MVAIAERGKQVTKKFLVVSSSDLKQLIICEVFDGFWMCRKVLTHNHQRFVDLLDARPSHNVQNVSRQKILESLINNIRLSDGILNSFMLMIFRFKKIFINIQILLRVNKIFTIFF